MNRAAIAAGVRFTRRQARVVDADDSDAAVCVPDFTLLSLKLYGVHTEHGRKHGNRYSADCERKH